MISLPTLYNGIRFRSKLEATYCALFDLFGWKYEYEPGLLDGYIPDFILDFSPIPVLVEVKPISTIEEAIPHYHKIRKSGWKDEILIVGSKIPIDNPCYGYDNILGFVTDVWWEWDGLQNAYTFKCLKCGEISFCSDEGSYHCRVNGCYDGDHYLGGLERKLEDYWRMAYNNVQYIHRRN